MEKNKSPFNIYDIFNSASNIGGTGIVLLNKIINTSSHGSKLYAKLEGLNPGGSVKDRPALYMIKNAVEKGLIKENTSIIDSSSGNTGISYAMIGALLGIKVKIYAPSNMSEERK